MPSDQGFQPFTVEKGIRQIGPSRWEVRAFLGRDPTTGKVRHISRTTTTGIKEARKMLARLTTEVADGVHGGPAAGTFGALLDDWVERGKQGRAATTIFAYRQSIDATIRPALGSITLDRLTAQDIDGFYADLLKSGKSPARVKQFHRIISAALAQGEKWDLVRASVARKASPPRVDKKPLNPPPPDRVRALIDAAASSHTPELATMITVAALTGMRRGELCGLRWSDIDWQGSALTVHRSISETPGRLDHKLPKTHQVRHLELGEHTMAVLAGRLQRMMDAASEAEIDLVEDAYVFSPSIDGSAPMRPSTVTQAFGRLCRRMEGPATKAAKEAGRKLQAAEMWNYRFHDLRHYTATELFRAGHHARTVADRLGHSDPALTLRVYTHDTQDQAIAAATSLEVGLGAVPSLAS